jgi:adenine/guanine phosphoribosyltransferase-like PRPP-binding protein
MPQKELAEQIVTAVVESPNNNNNQTKIEVAATVATLGIPVDWAVARALGLHHVVVLQKTPKIHLQQALVESVFRRSPPPMANSKLLRLDRARIPVVANRSTVWIGSTNDVISSGSSTAASHCDCLRRAGAKVGRCGGYCSQKVMDGDEDAAIVTALGKIPLFRPVGPEGWIKDWSC